MGNKRKRDADEVVCDLLDAKRVLSEANANRPTCLSRSTGFKKQIASLFNAYEAQLDPSSTRKQHQEFISALLGASTGVLPCKILAASLLPKCAAQTSSSAAVTLPSLVTLYEDTLSSRNTFASSLTDFTPQAGVQLTSSIAAACAAAGTLHPTELVDGNLNVGALTHQLLWCLGALVRSRPTSRTSSRGQDRDSQRSVDKQADVLTQRRHCCRALASLLQADAVAVLVCSFTDLLQAQGCAGHGASEFLDYCMSQTDDPCGAEIDSSTAQPDSSVPATQPVQNNPPAPISRDGTRTYVLSTVLDQQADTLQWIRNEVPARLAEASATRAPDQVFRLLEDILALLPQPAEPVSRAAVPEWRRPRPLHDLSPTKTYPNPGVGFGPHPGRLAGTPMWSPLDPAAVPVESRARKQHMALHVASDRVLTNTVDEAQAAAPNTVSGFSTPGTTDALEADLVPTNAPGDLSPASSRRRRKSRFDVPPPGGAELPRSAGPRVMGPHRGAGPPFVHRMHPRFGGFADGRPRHPDFLEDRGARDYPPARHFFPPAYPPYRGGGPHAGPGRGYPRPTLAPLRVPHGEISRVEQASRCIWVRCIPPGLSEAAVADQCKRFAPAVDVIFPTRPGGDEALVTFATIMDAACGYESLLGTRIWAHGRVLEAGFCKEEPPTAPPPRPGEGVGMHVWIAGADNPAAEEAVMSCLYDAGVPTPEVLRVAGRGPGLLLQFQNLYEVKRAIDVLRTQLLSRPPGGYGRAAHRGVPPGPAGPGCVWVHMVNGPVHEHDILDALRRFGQILRWQMLGPSCLFAELPHDLAAFDAQRALDGLRFGPAIIRVEIKGPLPHPQETARHTFPLGTPVAREVEPGPLMEPLTDPIAARAPASTPSHMSAAVSGALSPAGAPLAPVSRPSAAPMQALAAVPVTAPLVGQQLRQPTYSPTRAPLSRTPHGALQEPAPPPVPAASASASGHALTGTSTASSNKVEGQGREQGEPAVLWSGPLAKSGVVQCRVKVVAPAAKLLAVGGAPAETQSWATPLNVSFRLPFEPVFGKDVFRAHPPSHRTLLSMEADTSDVANVRGFQEFVEYLGTKQRAGVVKPLCPGKNAYLIPYSAAAAQALDLGPGGDTAPLLLMLIIPSASRHGK